MNISEISSSFLTELIKAEDKFPGWPQDVIHAAAIVSEERGELLKAAIDFYFGRGTREDLRKEAIQVGAMATRFLTHLEDYQPLEKPKTKYLRKEKPEKPETCGDCTFFQWEIHAGSWCELKMTPMGIDSKGCEEGKRK